MQMFSQAPISSVTAEAYRVPTDAPESDGSLEWNATTLVCCRVEAAGKTGLGYSYASSVAAALIRDKVAPALQGADALEISARWIEMRRLLRNEGQSGITAMAVSAVDFALWDLVGRLLDQPVYRLLGAFRSCIQAYGSGGFTSYSMEQLSGQIEGWLERGARAVKMKIGRHPAEDPARIACARSTIGDERDLFVDANGAYYRAEALDVAGRLAEARVSWFEEPVSSDDVEGLAWLRDRRPPPVRIAAGEYAYHAGDFKTLLEAGAVDVLMADATRCGGATGFMRAAALAAAHHVPLSSHCAPTLHRHLGCAAETFLNAEYFHDHARIEPMLFDGAAELRDGRLWPDPGRPGFGIDLKSSDAERYRV
ncbi:MAG TPA: enolase C-terminal domain-like protein [Gammaproteobacteria bacterium]|nr:enolase C-terminal domain-like protein [Gammaproteobacteria bacterium]